MSAVAVLASLFVAAAPADAAVRYPPPLDLITVSDSAPEAGEVFTVFVFGCAPGETATVEVDGAAFTAVAGAAAQTAIDVVAPAELGTYRLVVSCGDRPVGVVHIIVTTSLPQVGDNIRVSNTSPSAGGRFTVVVAGCPIGSVASVDFAGRSSSDVVGGGSSPTFTLTAPSSPGSYEVVARCDGSVIDSVVITVRAGPGGADEVIPAAGSDSTAAGLTIAAGLLTTGAGLLIVARVRRRGTVEPGLATSNLG